MTDPRTLADAEAQDAADFERDYPARHDDMHGEAVGSAHVVGWVALTAAVTLAGLLWWLWP